MSEKKARSRKISDESVRKKIGKGWGKWYVILDEWGMKEKGHILTIKHLYVHYGLSP